MARVDKFETPLLRVSRPVSACQRCRHAKVKCDGKLPACTACERAGRAAECSSANDLFARGKERSYVASLENRVEKLERQIAQAKARKATANTLDLVSAQPLLAPPILTHGGGRVRRKETQDVNDLVSDFGFLSVNATARDFHGFTRQMSFARLVLSTSSKEDMPKITVNMLPQRHAMTPLIEHYLENVHSLYPFLSEIKLFTAIDAVSQDSGGCASPIEHWTARMVLAVALASMSRRRGDTQYQDAVRHAAGALEHAESVVHPGSIVGIQAMLLLVLYAMLDPHHFNSWYLIGLASRAMVDIGIHQDPPKDSRLKESERDLSGRVYASIYALDRCISMVHRRGFSFTDDSAGSPFPTFPSIGKQVFSPNLEAAVQLNYLRQTQSYAYQRLFQSSKLASEDAMPIISSALSEMHRWSSTLHEKLPGLKIRPIRKLFRTDVLYSSILILSPPHLCEMLGDYSKFLIFEYAAEYAELMASISKDQERFAFYTYYDALAASFVAKRLTHTLYASSAILFSDSVPVASSSSFPPLGPSTIPARNVGERVNKAYACLTQLEEALGFLGPMYGYPKMLHDFGAQLVGIRHKLQTIYDNWNRNLGISRTQYVYSGGPIHGLSQ